MKKNMQEKLFKKYPQIFRQKDLSAQETAMCWGITCGDGWFDLIDDLCSEIQNRVNNVNSNRKYSIKSSSPSLIPIKTIEFICEATQVKEKFGSLRFYTQGGDDYINGMISLAESLSRKICSQCGNKKNIQQRRGWQHTLCKKCKNETR
jgi:hypothetical protein